MSKLHLQPETLAHQQIGRVGDARRALAQASAWRRCVIGPSIGARRGLAGGRFVIAVQAGHDGRFHCVRSIHRGTQGVLNIRLNMEPIGGPGRALRCTLYSWYRRCSCWRRRRWRDGRQCCCCLLDGRVGGIVRAGVALIGVEERNRMLLYAGAGDAGCRRSSRSRAPIRSPRGLRSTPDRLRRRWLGGGQGVHRGVSKCYLPGKLYSSQQ